MLKAETAEDKGVNVEVQAESQKQISNELLGMLISLEQEGYGFAVMIAITGYKRYLISQEGKEDVEQ